MHNRVDIGASLVDTGVHPAFARRFAIALDRAKPEIEHADIVGGHLQIVVVRGRDREGLAIGDAYREIAAGGHQVALLNQPMCGLHHLLLGGAERSHSAISMLNLTLSGLYGIILPSSR